MPLRSLAQATKLRETNPEVYKRLLKDTKNIRNLPMRVKKKTIKTPKSEMVKEHTHLVKVLRSGKKSQLKAEAKKQSKELKEYRRAKKYKYPSKYLKNKGGYKKVKKSIDNKMKWLGEYDEKTNKIKINKKRAKKAGKGKVLETIYHENLHQKHPKMHEKTVYKLEKNYKKLSRKSKQKLYSQFK